jgi:hypothetical protein
MSSDDRKDDQTPPHARPHAAGQDADVHPGEQPETMPETMADAREQAQAASFAALLDRLTTGLALPPAMTAEERTLVETAGMVRASARPVALAPERQSALIEEALHAALGRGGAGNRAHAGSKGIHGAAPERVPSRAPGRDQSRPDRSDTSDAPAPIDLGERRRGRYFRALPWAMASVAAALLLVLWQSRTGRLSPAAPTVVAQRAPLDTVHRSRPADVLIGEIPRSRADAARTRIDMIYADRLIGYRDLRLRGDRL